MRNLKQKYRAAIHLFHDEGYSICEIGNILTAKKIYCQNPVDQGEGTAIQSSATTGLPPMRHRQGIRVFF
jgi:hypothetical protein